MSNMRTLEDGPILAVLLDASGPFVRGERAGIFGARSQRDQNVFRRKPVPTRVGTRALCRAFAKSG
jgi:hypothetical protein